MTRVRVDAYRKADGTRVKSHWRNIDTSTTVAGGVKIDLPGSGDPIRKSSLADAKAQGAAVKAGGLRARVRRARLALADKADAPQGGSVYGRPTADAVEDFEIRHARRQREIKALDKALSKPKRTGKGIKAASR